jgi:hypothetical protein
MPYEFLKKLSRKDVELQRLNQLNILKFSVLYEDILIKERGKLFLEEIRNESLDKLLIINEILSEHYDNDTPSK